MCDSPDGRLITQARQQTSEHCLKVCAFVPGGSSKYPPAEPVALRLLAPQMGLIATGESKSKNKSKSLGCELHADCVG
jgi:hypothetical protein